MGRERGSGGCPRAAEARSPRAAPPRGALRHRAAGPGGWEDSPLLPSYRGARSAITGRIRVNEEQLAAAGAGRQT